MIVISMDSHTELIADLKPFMAEKWQPECRKGEDIARRYFKDIFKAYSGVGAGAMAEINPMAQMRDNVKPEDWQRPLPMNQRLKMIDADGVAAEFITPFVGPYSDSLEFLHECTLAYHRYFEDYISPAPYRFTGSTVVNLICGMETVLEEIDDAHKHGLRAVSLPDSPSFVSQDLPTYNAHYYDPMWTVLSERNMAAIFHAGQSREKPLFRWDGTIYPWSRTGKPEPGWETLCHLATLGLHDYLTQILAGAVLERFPGMRLGILESGAKWIPELLNQVETFWQSEAKSGVLLSYRSKMSPLEQWHRQGFVATAFDKGEIELRSKIGVENMMWGSDFPHLEGTYPRSRETLHNIFAGVPEAEAEAILSTNAARMMGFDLEKLKQTPAAQIA